jgi:hypothetical protein
MVSNLEILNFNNIKNICFNFINVNWYLKKSLRISVQYFEKNSESGVITEFCLFQISNSVPCVVYKTRPCLLAYLFLYYFWFQHEFSETEGFCSKIWNTALQVAKFVSPGSGM